MTIEEIDKLIDCLISESISVGTTMRNDCRCASYQNIDLKKDALLNSVRKYGDDRTKLALYVQSRIHNQDKPAELEEAGKSWGGIKVPIIADQDEPAELEGNGQKWEEIKLPKYEGDNNPFDRMLEERIEHEDLVKKLEYLVSLQDK